MKKYTIKDIAELAGVSKGTVDRVIHKRGKVSQKALEKVNKLLEEIDYQPNPIARNLKNNKVYQICVLLPDPNKDPFWYPCLEGINDAILEFKSFGISIESFFFNPASTESFKEVSQTVLNLSPDAVLIAPLFYNETVKAIKKYNSSNIIVSTFNNQIKSDDIKSFVGQDLFQSGRTAARLMHMVTVPKSEIVIIHIDETFNNALHMQQKESGFRSYFEEMTGNINNLLTYNAKKTDLNELLIELISPSHNISGIFITTSKAYKVAEIIQYFGDKNIKIIGYDLLDENIAYLKNNIIHFLIHQNPKRQTYLALTYLVEYFLFNKDIPNQKLLPIDIVNSENVTHYKNN